jgi:predicted DNA binding CopG/RHH family protein
MQYYELDQEEQDILRSFEDNEWTSVPDKQQRIATLRAASHNTLTRSKNINIRLSQRDLMKLKARAAEQGIPYQTLIASVLHQYGNKV